MSLERHLPNATPRGARRVVHVVATEFRHVIPPTIFFAVGFNLIVFSTNLILADYSLRLGGFLIATTTALIVGKAVLVAEKMPLLRRFDNAPLVLPILFKTLAYWFVVFIVRFLENFIHHAYETGQVTGFIAWRLQEGLTWHRFLFVQLWILVLFLVYVTAVEINALFGEGELFRALFRRRRTSLWLTRRQHIQTLVRLGRLAEENTIDEIRDPNTRAHEQFVALVQTLAPERPETPVTAKDDRRRLGDEPDRRARLVSGRRAGA